MLPFKHQFLSYIVCSMSARSTRSPFALFLSLRVCFDLVSFSVQFSRFIIVIVHFAMLTCRRRRCCCYVISLVLLFSCVYILILPPHICIYMEWGSWGMAIWCKRQCLKVFAFVFFFCFCFSFCFSFCPVPFFLLASVLMLWGWRVMLSAMCCVSHCLQFESTPIPCTHPFPPSLLLHSSTFHQHSFHRPIVPSFVLSFDFFSVCFFSLFSTFFLVLFFIGANATSTFAGTFDIVAVARIFLRYLLFYINFRLCIHAQCSYCGKNSIRFLSSIFSHFVSFFFWYIFFRIFFVHIFFFCCAGVVDVFHSVVNMCVDECSSKKEIDSGEWEREKWQMERIKWFQKDATVVCLFLCLIYFRSLLSKLFLSILRFAMFSSLLGLFALFILCVPIRHVQHFSIFEKK